MSVNINLYHAKTDGVFELVRLPNIPLLESLGKRKGTMVSITGRLKLGGPVLLRVENAFVVAIGKDIATQILVKEACGECPTNCKRTIMSSKAIRF